MVRSGLVICMLAGCISPVMHFGSGKSAKQAQRDTMSELGPARLVTDATWSGEVSTRKIRVWADDQYRAQNVKWQQSFEQPLELANLVLTPVFGLRLVAEYVAWERHVPGATLADDIAALAERDPGRDVFAVVGLTSSLPLVSATFEELGLASVGGRHLVLRGYADLEERKLYADAFSDLRADERELALDARRHHKTAVVLLHELAHNLGAGHEASDTIMNASYSPRAAAFSDRARDVVLRTLDQRLARAATTPEAPDAPVPTDPDAEHATPREPATHHAPVIVRVSQSGAAILDGKPVADAALGAVFAAAFAEDPDTQIVIRSDRKVPVGAVGSVIDRAKAAGLTKFAFGSSGL